MHNSDTNFNWSCPIDENRPGSCQLLYFSVTSICWFTLYFFLFSKIGKYRLFKNLDMNAVFFYKCLKFSLCMSLLPVCQQVDSRKAAAKQVYQVQDTLIEKKAHSERSAESRTPRRKVQEDEKLIGLFNSETVRVRGVFLLSSLRLH